MTILMNKFKHISLISFLAVMFVSCVDDRYDDFPALTSDNISRYVPQHTFVFNCHTLNARDGKFYLMGEVKSQSHIDSLLHLEISKVDFYVDGTRLATVDKAPFKLDMALSTIANGAHQTRAVVTAEVQGYGEPIVYAYEQSFYRNRATSFVDLFFDYSFVTNGDVFTITPAINSDRSSKGAKIVEASLSWDNKTVDTSNSEPWTLSHLVTESVRSRHAAKATVKTNYGNYDFTLPNLCVLPQDTVVLAAQAMSSFKDYKRSESLKIAVKAFGSKVGANKCELKVLLDGKTVATANTFPTTVVYSLRDVAVGFHDISFTWSIEDSNTKTGSTSYDYIFVTE